MGKHAYLIMAHNEFYILKKLLLLIDDERNDIYIHIDKKVKNFNFNDYKKLLKKSNIYFIKRYDVRWGTNKQILCSLELLKSATIKKYSYYHFISGVDLPIKNQDYIHHFFEQNDGKEFINFDSFNSISNFHLSRVKYYHFFVNYLRTNKEIINRFFAAIRFRLFKLQEKFGINRLKNANIEFRKGANWFSITHNCAIFLLSNKDKLKYFKFSYCADELYIQTIIYNSKFKSKLYKDIDKNYTSLRYTDWEKGNPYILTSEEYDIIMNSEMLFARKFSAKIDKAVIDKIYNIVK